jgi:hypothetical protein
MGLKNRTGKGLLFAVCTHNFSKKFQGKKMVGFLEKEIVESKKI